MELCVCSCAWRCVCVCFQATGDVYRLSDTFLFFKKRCPHPRPQTSYIIFPNSFLPSPYCQPVVTVEPTTFGGNMFACTMERKYTERDWRELLKREMKRKEIKWWRLGLDSDGAELSVNMRIFWSAFKYLAYTCECVCVSVWLGLQYVFCLETFKPQSTWGAKETILSVCLCVHLYVFHCKYCMRGALWEKRLGGEQEGKSEDNISPIREWKELPLGETHGITPTMEP